MSRTDGGRDGRMNAVGVGIEMCYRLRHQMHMWCTFEASSVSMSFSSSRMLLVDSNNSFRMVSSILYVGVLCGGVCVLGGMHWCTKQLLSICILQSKNVGIDYEVYSHTVHVLNMMSTSGTLF